MNNLDQLIAQASQLFTKLFNEVAHLTDQTDEVFISEILGHLWALLKAIIQFVIIALEALIKILKFFVH